MYTEETQGAPEAPQHPPKPRKKREKQKLRLLMDSLMGKKRRPAREAEGHATVDVEVREDASSSDAMATVPEIAPLAEAATVAAVVPEMAELDALIKPIEKLSTEELIPARHLPSAAERLAELFPPEGPVAAHVQGSASAVQEISEREDVAGETQVLTADSAGAASEGEQAAVEALAAEAATVEVAAGEAVEAPIEAEPGDRGQEESAIAGAALIEAAEGETEAADVVAVEEIQNESKPSGAEQTTEAGIEHTETAQAEASAADTSQGAEVNIAIVSLEEVPADVRQAAIEAIENAMIGTEAIEAALVETVKPSPLEAVACAEITSAPEEQIVPSAAANAESSLPYLSEPPAGPPPELSEDAKIRSSGDWAFEEKLARHRGWIDSKGVAGKKVDLTSADLEGTELISADLRFADMRDANLKAADLLLADLRDACLMRANLQDSCLVGANLEGANLEGASLESSMGLVPRQLAGTNLHDATLPKSILKFEALPEFERASQMSSKLFVAAAGMSLLSWLIIWRTKDVQLLGNLSVLSFLHSATAAAALPADQFYLIAPVTLFLVYAVFHFHLQRLWDAVLELPAVFPDGRVLGERTPRIVTGLLRVHFRWMNNEAPSTREIEKKIAVLAAYWLVPLTLLLYWARFLTLQDIHGTILQDLLAVAATGIAIYSMTRVGRPEEKWGKKKDFWRRSAEKLKMVSPAALAACLAVVLTFISAGTMAGVPVAKNRAPQYLSGSIRRWGAAALWSIGFEPYADLTEAVISKAPDGWSGTDDKLGQVKGARLKNANFRYAQGYGVFLAGADLWQADFQGASLSMADLRGTSLGQSNFKFADLDQARLTHANLDRANLSRSNLGRTDLREANLSYGQLTNTFLTDARLDGATLYGAQLNSTTAVRTNFEKADLREANLENANLDFADLQQAYLWSAKLGGAHLDNARLGGAIFIAADLHGADLRGAQFSGTVLSEAELGGTNLDGADLRGASGLTAKQVCSAKSRRWVQLEETLQMQVEAQCGAAASH